MTSPGHPWKDDERRNWEYADLRLRAFKYVLGAGSGMQAVSLRGHLLLDIAVTQLLLSNVASNIGYMPPVPFGRKLKVAAKHGLVSPEIRYILSEVARIRNAHAHELATRSTFRQVHALSVRAQEAGIEDRFRAHDDEVEVTLYVAAKGELADHLFDPASELANLCAEVFSHIVFWNYDSFDLVNLRSTLDDVRWQ
jgi:hypothetical protein